MYRDNYILFIHLFLLSIIFTFCSIKKKCLQNLSRFTASVGISFIKKQIDFIIYFNIVLLLTIKNDRTPSFLIEISRIQLVFTDLPAVNSGISNKKL